MVPTGILSGRRAYNLTFSIHQPSLPIGWFFLSQGLRPRPSPKAMGVQSCGSSIPWEYNPVGVQSYRSSIPWKFNLWEFNPVGVQSRGSLLSWELNPVGVQSHGSSILWEFNPVRVQSYGGVINPVSGSQFRGRQSKIASKLPKDVY